MRDIQFLSQLTTNVLRVSYIDPTQDHTACMTALQSAGIYVLVDLPGAASINSTNPEWNLDIYNSWTQRIDAIAGHNNVLGFFAGNNIVTDSSNSPAAAFVKAAVRDLKSYIKGKYNRTIPVGYEKSIADNYDIMSLYMTCSNTSESIDFLGISDFDSCSNDTSASFDLLSDEYANYPVPVFFADYGCKDADASARGFEEVAYIYGNPMTNIVSGGIVYEYFQDEEDKGNKSLLGDSNISC
jgi:1,3-beta-glucanosyltransferase GAS1